MADSKLSALPECTSIGDSDELYVNDSGASKRTLWSTIKSELKTYMDTLYATLVHATRHQSGGADAIKLDDLAAPDANTDLNASTTAHGLMVAATAPSAGIRNAVVIDNGETVYKVAALFDNTNPADTGSASPGTSLIAARRDHVHNAPASAHTQNTDTGTTGASFTVDSDATTGKITVTAAAGAANKALTITNAALTDDRTFTIPDASGTAVLTGAITGSGLTMATAKVLGRTTASTGAVEELSAGTVGLAVLAGATAAAAQQAMDTEVGVDVLAYSASVVNAATEIALPASDDTATGLRESGTAGETVAIGNLLYMKSDGKWWKSDADAASTMPGMRLALESKNADEACKLLVYGAMRNDDWNWTVGGLIYAGTDAGALTQTAPSGSGDQVQVVGVAYHADKMFFCPSPVLVEIA
jgi:hypothetical protein